MRVSLSISLPEKLAQELESLAKQSSISKSEIVRNALEEYLFKYRFHRLRKRLVSKAQEKGIFTDEDVFNLLNENKNSI